MTFADAPAPLTNRERAIYWIVAAVCGASRFAALSRSLWDWDEVLFCFGIRSYDVSLHHPHPPGFPVYIAAAKIARLFTDSNFHALRALNLIAAVLIFPAMFMLARELHLRFTTATIAGALFAFLPNVWFFGGTAFSDIPSIVLVVYAVAFLFRGCRDGNAYVIGAFLLALSIGIRPQNALVGLFPAALSTWYRARRSVRDVIFAALIGGTIVIVSYAGAIAATGSYQRYVNAVREHGDYITQVDSFRSPDRPPLWRLLDRFFEKQYDNPALNVALSFFVLVSIVGAVRTRNRWLLANALTFAPFAISAWLMLDRYSVSRFSIGYQPMFIIFAADGIARLWSALARQRLFKGGVKPPHSEGEAILGGVLIVVSIIWTIPGLNVARRELSPPVLSIDAVRHSIDPNRSDLYVAFPLMPFVNYLLPSMPYRLVLDERAMPLSAPPRPAWLLTEIERTTPSGRLFARPRDPLWYIARRHYFEIALEPVRTVPQFGAGWYPAEWHGGQEWRWMQKRSVMVLPPAHPRANLRLQFDIPADLMPLRPNITVALNGATIDRFTPATANLTREYDVTPGPGPNTLVITTDRSLNELREHLGRDPRELGLRLLALSWGSEP